MKSFRDLLPYCQFDLIFQTRMLRLLLIVVLVGVAVSKTCVKDSECDDGQCCQRPKHFSIASKRRIVIGGGFFNPKGSCRNYGKMGDRCQAYARQRGFCGCGGKLYCKRTAVLMKTWTRTTEGPIIGKRMVAFELPPKGHRWQRKCEARNSTASYYS